MAQTSPEPPGGQPAGDDSIQFTCNLCGKGNRRPARELGRENPSCGSCGSTVRQRGLLRALSLELFGISLPVPDFPTMKSLRGIGTSDTAQYAALLAERFDYRNTFHDRPPEFDIMRPREHDFGMYDFVISSEVFEHVPPPVETAFSNVLRMLKPNGVLVFTVPYSIEDRTLEHYPDLHEYAVTRLGGSSVLLNRTTEGLLQVFDNLVFHLSSSAALEMREFAERDFMTMLAGVGFAGIQVHGENYEPFGILYPEPWSLPLAARRGGYALGRESAREIMEELVDSQWQCREVKQRLDAQAELEQRAQALQSELDRLNRTMWNRVGRKLRLL
jgi:SAM-dependent methyltransferase